MIVRRERPFGPGYTAVTELGDDSGMLMDFGILRLDAGSATRDTSPRERAFLLMDGTVDLAWAGETRRVTRGSLVDDEPWVLHVPAGVAVSITAVGGTAELAVQKVANESAFASRLYAPGDYRSELFGHGTLQGTAIRRVRTVFDAATAPESNMVLGEVVGYPGKWSSYPPHHHPQPEVYHFRFFPEGGFGYSEQGDEVYKVQDGDTALIPPNVTHPQVAAPGFVMYYVWMIPHLPGGRFGPDSREFVEDFRWLLDSRAPIWAPEAGEPGPTE